MRFFPYPPGIWQLVCIERCLGLLQEGGCTALVMPQSWQFQRTYKGIRAKLLNANRWNFVARVGSGAFSTAMWDFNIVLSIFTKSGPTPQHLIASVDASDALSVTEKAKSLNGLPPALVSQKAQLANPDHRIVVTGAKTSTRLSNIAETYKGICSGDSSRFQRRMWELPRLDSSWAFQQGSIPHTQHFGGRDGVFLWEQGEGVFQDFVVERLGESGTAAWVRGEQAWGRTGVVVRIMGELPVTRFTGELFDNNVAVVVVRTPEELPALWAFCESSEYNLAVRALNQKVSVTDESFVHVPFNLEHWQKVAAERYPNGLPKPHSDDPTQWLFNGHPKGSDAPLQVAVARLLGYRWPRQTGSEFPDCPALGPDGLESHGDADGIVCLPPINREQPAADRPRTGCGGCWRRPSATNGTAGRSGRCSPPPGPSRTTWRTGCGTASSSST